MLWTPDPPENCTFKGPKIARKLSFFLKNCQKSHFFQNFQITIKKKKWYFWSLESLKQFFSHFFFNFYFIYLFVNLKKKWISMMRGKTPIKNGKKNAQNTLKIARNCKKLPKWKKLPQNYNFPKNCQNRGRDFPDGHIKVISLDCWHKLYSYPKKEIGLLRVTNT